MNNKPETYIFGRFLIRLAVGLGWIAAAIAVIVGLIAVVSTKSIAGLAVAVGALLAAMLSHGFWQLVGAVLDIADDSREARIAAQSVARVVRADAFERKATDGGR